MDSSPAQWRKRLLLLRGLLVVVVALMAAAASLRQVSVPALLWPFIAVLWAPVLLYWPTRRQSPRAQQNWLAAELLYDTLAFMLLVYALGGATNPLTFYLLMPLLITALTQNSARTLMMCLGQIGAYGVLLYWHQVPSSHSELHAMTHEMPALHGQGMWLAFSLLAIALAVLGQSSRRAQALHVTQQATELTLALQRERMYQLATSMADRAHELTTPLSTLALQLDGLLDTHADDAALRAELEQIQALVERMADLLRQQQHDHQDAGAVTPAGLTAQLAEALKLLAPTLTVIWRGTDDLPLTPAFAWQRIFLNLGYNACDAGATQLEISSRRDGDRRLIQVSDNGPRQPDRERAGLGIGLALVETTLASMGGVVELRRHAHWTQALISVPETPTR